MKAVVAAFNQEKALVGAFSVILQPVVEPMDRFAAEMEYADGGNLAETLAKQTVRMEERDIIAIFSQIVSAIRHMHDNNVLHRDLKTANIFLTKENMVKVGDFGISKVGPSLCLCGVPVVQLNML